MQTQTRVHTSVATKVGTALIALSTVAFAAAGGLAAARIGAKLVIKPLPYLVSSSISPGAQDHPALALSMEAQNRDITVDTLTFTVFGDDDGSFSTIENDLSAQDHIESCSLHAKVSGAQVAGPEAIDASGQLVFSQLNTTIPRGKTLRGEIRCDFANVPPENGTPDVFAVALLQDADVEAEEAQTGNSLTDAQIVLARPADPGINPNGAVAITINGTGTLSAELAPSSPSDGILIGGTTNSPVATYQFIAEHEPFVVNSLLLMNMGSANALSSITLTYTNASGATVRTTSAVTNNQAEFRGLSLYATPGTRSLLEVSVETNPIPLIADSGETVSLMLNGGDMFEAYGENSNEIISTLGSNIPASTFTLRKTKPTISLGARSPSGSAVPSFQEVLHVNIASDTHEDTRIHQLIFQVTSQGSGWNACGGGSDLGSAAKWEFYNLADPSTKLDDDGDWSFREADGSTCEPGDTLAYAVLNLAANPATPSEEIGAGQTETYALRLNTTGARIDDVLQLSIPEEAAVSWASTFVWDDFASSSNINGAFIRNLPVTGRTLLY